MSIVFVYFNFYFLPNERCDISLENLKFKQKKDNGAETFQLLISNEYVPYVTLLFE